MEREGMGSSVTEEREVTGQKGKIMTRGECVLPWGVLTCSLDMVSPHHLWRWRTPQWGRRQQENLVESENIKQL